MNQYAKIKDGRVENIIVSKAHPEPANEYVWIYDNSSLIQIGYQYESGTGFTPFKGEVITELNLQKNVADINSNVSIEERRNAAKEFRNNLLKNTDWVISATDHPQIEAYKAYRQKLRDWPESPDFPSQIPEL